MLIKCISIGFITVIVSMLLRKDRPELSIIVNIAGGIIMLIMIIGSIKELVDIFNDAVSSTNISSSLIKSLLKVIGIGYITEFTASIFEESGSKSIADKVVLCGKIVILIIAFPLIKNVLEIILNLIK